MESLGEQLRKKREEKNLSLEELSYTTRISVKNLEAIEHDDYDSFLLPPVYIKGFIRAYCRQVGLDDKEVLRVYKEVRSSKQTETPQIQQAMKKTPHRNKVLMLLIVIAGLVGVLLYIFYTGCPFPGNSLANLAKNITKSRGKTTLSPEMPSVQSASPPSHVQEPEAMVQEPPREVLPQEPLPPVELVSPPAVSALKIKIEGQANTWVEVTIDSNPPFDVMLYRGNVVSWEANDKIELKVGNAGGILMSVNNLPLKPFGKSGEVVRLLFQGNTFSLNGREPQSLESWQEKKEGQSTSG
jgi:cytoskeleton protein RodZ